MRPMRLMGYPTSGGMTRRFLRIRIWPATGTVEDVGKGACPSPRDFQSQAAHARREDDCAGVARVSSAEAETARRRQAPHAGTPRRGRNGASEPARTRGLGGPS